MFIVGEIAYVLANPGPLVGLVGFSTSVSNVYLTDLMQSSEDKLCCVVCSQAIRKGGPELGSAG